MLSTYKEKILKELEGVPGEMMPKLYKIIHLLTTELIQKKGEKENRGSFTKKLQDLSPELLEEVIDFIEFLKIKRVKKGNIDVSSLLIQQESLNRIWQSENEDVYEL
jgi:hypothetical protein